MRRIFDEERRKRLSWHLLMKGEEYRAFVWYFSVIISVLGSILAYIGWYISEVQFLFYGIVITTFGTALICLVVIYEDVESLFIRDGSTGEFLFITVGSVIFLVSIFISLVSWNIGIFGRLYAFALAIQSLIISVENHPSKTTSRSRTVNFFGHIMILTGTLLGITTESIGFRESVLFYICGFPIVIQYTFWMRTYRSTVETNLNFYSDFWEFIFCVSLITWLISTFTFTASFSGYLLASIEVSSLAALISAMSLIILISLLSYPSNKLNSSIPDNYYVKIGQHTLVIILSVNLLVTCMFIIMPSFLSYIIVLYMVLLTLSVTMRYGMIFYWQKEYSNSFNNKNTENDGENEDYEGEDQDDEDINNVTVLVTAYNEIDVIKDTLKENINSLSAINFLLVPADKSDDGTIEFMNEMRESHPDRVRILKGRTGSKAGDLNIAWKHVETDYAIILDADEKIDMSFVEKGVKSLEENEEIGIVQGRKVARNPHKGILSSFISIERAHSTLLDHVFTDDILDAGHFAGSSAIFRTEVPKEIDGWDSEYLTEDIELTLRVYLNTHWALKYRPDMVAYESNPTSLTGLIKQRERWARGWSQVTFDYLWNFVKRFKQFGPRKTFGSFWILFSSISAPFYTLFPAVLLFWIIGIGPSMGYSMSILIALYLLPERGISFAYTAIKDPVITYRVRDFISVILYAYLWMILGWIIQIHSIYLEISGAEAVWRKTDKS